MSEKSKNVAIVRCETYGKECIYQAVKHSIELLGGIKQFLPTEKKVFLKFNMLLGADSKTCITTNPDAVYAVAKLLKENGYQVVMGDSPGSGLPYTEAVLKREYAASGYDKLSEELDIPLNYDTGYTKISAPKGKITQQFFIINPAFEADAIVVVSKAKTHSLTFFSGAAKNMFGVIPGLEKPLCHAKYRSASEFGQFIVDLNEAMKPKLQVIDAVMGMEGDGPHSGTPRKIGAVLSSGNYSAIDVAAAKLMSIDPMRVPTISAAVERGIISGDFDDINILGEPLESLVVKGYKLPSTYGTPRAIDSRRMEAILSYIIPQIQQDKCIGCLKCVRACPMKAITVKDKKPQIDYEKCIRCYCCHEMCDNHAIQLERKT